MLLHKPQQAGKWARFLPKTIPFFSVHFVLSEKGNSRRIATYQPIASLLSFFCAQSAGKKDFILGHLSKRNPFAFLHNMPSKNLQPLCAVISKVYSIGPQACPYTPFYSHNIQGRQTSKSQAISLWPGFFFAALFFAPNKRTQSKCSAFSPLP